MILKRLKLDTPLGEPTNCYIIVDEATKETMVIDPAGEIGRASCRERVSCVL